MKNEKYYHIIGWSPSIKVTKTGNVRTVPSDKFSFRFVSEEEVMWKDEFGFERTTWVKEYDLLEITE